MADLSRTHPDQLETTETVVTMPDGRTQSFVEVDGRYYINDTTKYFDADQFARGIAKVTAEGASVATRTVYAWR